MISSIKRPPFKRIIWSLLLFAGCLIILFIALLSWSIINSYHRDILSELTSPDGNSSIIVTWDTEDDPYYVFELRKKKFPGGNKLLGECLQQWEGPEHAVSRWIDNKHFLLQVKQNE